MLKCRAKRAKRANTETENALFKFYTESVSIKPVLWILNDFFWDLDPNFQLVSGLDSVSDPT